MGEGNERYETPSSNYSSPRTWTSLGQRSPRGTSTTSSFYFMRSFLTIATSMLSSAAYVSLTGTCVPRSLRGSTTIHLFRILAILPRRIFWKSPYLRRFDGAGCFYIGSALILFVYDARRLSGQAKSNIPLEGDGISCYVLPGRHQAKYGPSNTPQPLHRDQQPFA